MASAATNRDHRAIAATPPSRTGTTRAHRGGSRHGRRSWRTSSPECARWGPQWRKRPRPRRRSTSPTTKAPSALRRRWRRTASSRTIGPTRSRCIAPTRPTGAAGLVVRPEVFPARPQQQGDRHGAGNLPAGAAHGWQVPNAADAERATRKHDRGGAEVGPEAESRGQARLAQASSGSRARAEAIPKLADDARASRHQARAKWLNETIRGVCAAAARGGVPARARSP